MRDRLIFAITFLFICCSPLLTNSCLGQENLVSKLLAYKTTVDKTPIEKIHIQTNLPFYTSGDTIWFKAYIIDANLNRPSSASHTLMLELTGTDGTLIKQVKTKVLVGLSDGYLILPDSLVGGSYMLRAYTNTMNRYGEDFYYKRSLRISGAVIPAPSKPDSGHIDLSFFPEGGDLVEGLESSVGFKALGDNGLGIDIRGTIRDDKGKVVSEINTAHLGMGKFRFTPQLGRKYFAQITDSSNRNHNFQLPSTKENGYVLSAYMDPDSIRLKLTYTKAKSSAGSVTIIGRRMV